MYSLDFKSEQQCMMFHTTHGELCVKHTAKNGGAVTLASHSLAQPKLQAARGIALIVIVLSNCFRLLLFHDASLNRRVVWHVLMRMTPASKVFS